VSANWFARSRLHVGRGNGFRSWWNSAIISSTIWHSFSNTCFSSSPYNHRRKGRDKIQGGDDFGQ
jgi:hypothetical protein